MKISAIKQQVKRADRYSVYVDGKYMFSLSETALLDARIANGQELDAAALQAYQQLSIEDKAYGRALRYAAMRPRSEREMQVYLQRREANPPAIEQILAKLRRIGLLDDTAFARSWVENRRLLKPSSRRRLNLELRQKGVAEAIISEVLRPDKLDERQALQEIAVKKRRLSRYRAEPQKLMQYLARQGFAYDDIKAVMNEEA